MTDIKFYSHTSGKYICFSNFYDSEITINSKLWPTTEHYFQANKFSKNLYREKIRTAKTPYEAKSLGRSREYKIDSLWDLNREDVMFDACYAKFTQHKDLQKILLDTGNATLIENSTNDYIWGCGKNGTGKNLLGKTLMKVRKTIRDEHDQKLLIDIDNLKLS